MKLKTRKISNITKRTTKKKFKKQKINTRRNRKNKYAKKTRKNRKYGGSSFWRLPFLSASEDDLKQVEEIELENERKLVEENERKKLEEEINNLALTKTFASSKSRDNSNTSGNIEYTLSDIIEYALFTLNLNKKCIDNCRNKLCIKCTDSSSTCDDAVCNDFKRMETSRPSYVNANLCRQDFMKNYGGVPYHCAAYISMAAKLSEVKKQFEKTDPLYKCLDYFGDSYKGHPDANPNDMFNPDFIITKLNELKNNTI